MSRMFLGGVTTKPEVDLLFSKIDPVPGTDVSYEAVAEIVSEPVGSNRLRSITEAWKKRLFTERHVQVAAIDKRFHFMTAAEAIDSSASRLQGVGKAAARVFKKTKAVDPRELSEQQRATQNIILRESMAMIDVASSAVKQIKGPAPVSSPLKLPK